MEAKNDTLDDKEMMNGGTLRQKVKGKSTRKKIGLAVAPLPANYFPFVRACIQILPYNQRAFEDASFPQEVIFYLYS